ncbi:ankyrin repeat domain-containing protein [Neolewinella persica]|uniref:ankyrin repeat domain-containing protein n=1 Tax=Neolewinella persica TaxID=70998 RepID=UPI00038027C4|nr:ankyrin repeat domain-containing protein [Neolewinella persica]
MKNDNRLNRDTRRNFIKYAVVSAALAYSSTLIGADPFAVNTSSGVKQFLKACHQGNLEQVRNLLATDAGLLTAKDKTGRTGFTLALLAGHSDLGVFLREAGYEPDLHEALLARDWEQYTTLLGEPSAATERRMNNGHAMGGTPMWAAAAGGAGSDIWRVYAKGGDPNAPIPVDATSSPLEKALRYPDLAVAELTAASMLSNNADPNLSASAEASPLHIAAERGSWELVEMLVRLGSDVTRKNRKGKTAAQVAEYFGKKDVWDLLRNEQKIARICTTSRTAFDKDGKPYLAPDLGSLPYHLLGSLVGKSHGNLEAVQQTVKADPRLAHSVTLTSESGVEAGAHMGNKGIVGFLLENGAAYSLPTAVMQNDVTTVTRLLDEDPNRVHERGAHDFPLLVYPIIGKCGADMMNLLLERGAKVEAQHFLGTTALHWACMRGQLEVAELLVENGADVNRVGRKFSSQGQTPLQNTKDEKVAAFLRSKGAKAAVGAKDKREGY